MWVHIGLVAAGAMRQSLLPATFPGDHFVSDQGRSDDAFLPADLGPLSWLAHNAPLAAAGKVGFSPRPPVSARNRQPCK
ncbi:hypothetical protein MRX96_018536 [Rhipicephalus microplus]